MYVCPNDPDHKEFVVTAIETHDWLVDGQGYFIQDCGVTGDCAIADMTEYECNQCGAIAVRKSDGKAKEVSTRSS